MVCDECRAAISAQLDGEERDGEAASAAAHLKGCADCRAFADRAAHVTRLTRTRAVEPAPDLVAVILTAADGVGVPPSRPRHLVGMLRVGLGAVGVGQFALAASGLVAAGEGSHHGAVELAGASVAHFAHESSAWNLALAVAFLWAATGPSRVSGLVPVIGAFVGVLLTLSVLDVAVGRVDPGRLVTHGLVVAGLALLLILQRSTRGDGRRGSVRPPHRRPLAVGRAPGPAPIRDGDGAGLRPTARHRPPARRRAA